MSRLNVGNLDRFLRMLLGIVLIALAGAGVIGAWGYLGVLPMASAMFRYCPLYHALGIHTGRPAR